MIETLEIVEYKQDWQKPIAKQIVEICERLDDTGRWQKKWGMPYFVVSDRNIIGFWSAKNWISVFVNGGARIESKIYEPGDRKSDATIHIDEKFGYWNELERVIKQILEYKD